MKNDYEIAKKAKRRVRNYYICSILVVVVMCAVWWLVMTMSDSWVIYFGTLLVSLFLIRAYLNPLLLNKFFMSVINKKLDADTYLSMVYQGNVDSRFASMQLYGELWCGNYQNVIGICEKKLSEPKIAEKFDFFYFTYLANVYFDLGDDEKLRDVCARFEASVMNKKPGLRKKYTKIFQRMDFYKVYLSENTEDCVAWLNNNPPKGKLMGYKRMFLKARIAMMQGKEEEACGIYEALAREVPQLNYGKLASVILTRMENKEAEPYKFHAMIENVNTDVRLFPTRRVKNMVIGFILGICVGIILLSFGIGGGDSYSEYEAELCALVEKDHDNVEIIEAFLLQKGDEDIDAMFICRTDRKILVCRSYVYEGEDELYYEKITDVSIKDLLDESYVADTYYFKSLLEDYQVECCFYIDQADIPKNGYFVTSFNLDGKTVWYSVNDVKPIN